jgi:D-alanyl-lipoteichoic acid acyltransferase DltB (MBOAT superfamily)
MVRKKGLARLLRFGLKALLLSVLVVSKPSWLPHRLSESLGLAFQIYFMASGLADLSSSLFMLAGIEAREIFNAPFLAQSPTDFWSHRWNLLVSEFLRRTFFLPLARNGAPVLGMLFVFIQSGVAHEYFVAGILGLENYAPFRMLAFFTAQGIAIVLLRSHPVFRRISHAIRLPGRIALHYVWLVVTTPLFVGPISPILDAFDAFVAPHLGTISFR